MLLTDIAVFFVRNHHVRRQTVGERTDFTRGTAGGRLTGQRERTAAWLGDFTGQQVQVIDQVVGPHAAGMLVEAHRPVGDDFFLRIGIQLRQLFQLIFRYAGHFGGFIQRVLGNKGFVVLKAHRLRGIGSRVFRRFFQRMGWTQTVTDVRHTFTQINVLAKEILVDRIVLNDVVSDVVEDHQIGLRREDHAVIRQLKAAVLESGEHRDINIGIGQTTVGDARPQDRVHLRHIRAPQDESICMLDIVIAAHRFIHTKGTHKADYR